MSVESGSEQAAKKQMRVERTSERELVVTRTFDAPAKIVFDAWTKPELIVRWWAPRSFGMKLTTCEVDLRVGGKYRFVFEMTDGQSREFFGVYKEVEPLERLVSTDDEQKATDADEAYTATTFSERDGKTTVVVRQVFASKEELEAMAAGMEQGTHETYRQLDEVLSTLL